ncbi:ATP-binding protein [Paenibacillus sp. OAS669]|uniref:sensor histidine kinase n=1 Tax=Paenibacillus sp. OAS669 TaxID=2663821 RepID=UPI001789E42E|nr:ATP-binding protein [Paenibacillus sp. OAS669]MBE1443676.1 PAS domain S-box-containing protein [Paenibacillus sp. OAS669]
MKRLSMRLHLTITFAIVALIPILVLGTIQVQQIKNITNDYNKTQMQTTYRLADAVQTYTYYHRNAVETVAATISASSPPFRTRESMTLKLQSVKTNLPSFSRLFVVNRNGAVTSIYPDPGSGQQPALFGIDVRNRDYFNQVKASESTTITPLFRGIEGANKPAIAIAAPVYNEQKQWDGLIVGVLDMQAVAQLVTKYDYGTDAYPVVLDASGKAIYHPDGELTDSLTDLSNEPAVQEARAKKQGQGIYRSGVNRADELVSYTTIPDLDWTVLVARSYKAVNAAFTDSLRTTFLLLVITLLLTVIVGTLLAKRLTHTIHALVGYTRRLTDGVFPEPDRSITSRGVPYELHMLADHFTRMAGQIKENQRALIELNADLERRVAERTQSLLRKNQELEIVNTLLTPVPARKNANEVIEDSMVQLRRLIHLEIQLRLFPHTGSSGLGRFKGWEDETQASADVLDADRSVSVIPIQTGSLALGELVVHSDTDTLSDSDRKFLHTLSGTIAILVQNDMLLGSIRHEHATLNAVLESMSDAIVLIDTNRRVVYFNRRMTDMFGLKPAELLEMPEEELFHVMTGLLPEPDEDWTSFTLKQRPHAKFKAIGTGGKERFISVAAFQVSSGENSFGRGYVWRDITKEHEVDALKNDLISLASHEFKTPITSIRGSVETLLRPDASWDEDFKQELLEGIREDIGRIQDLIDEWLDISKIEAGALRVHLQPVRVQAVVQSAIERMPQHTGALHAAFELELGDDLPLLCADRLRLEQVLVNLFTNAIRYNQRQPVIRLSTTTDDRFVHIRVQDNGIGIEAEHLEHIFDRFYRVDVSSSRHTGGTGLGLAISKGIIEAHGGTIHVESTPGSGSVFTLSVPKYEWKNGDGHEEA